MRTGPFILLIGCSPPTQELVARAGADLTVETGAEVELDGSASSGAIEYIWTLGDGQSVTSSEPELSYQWAHPGHYTVYLEVRDDLGRTETDSLRLTVHHPLLSTAPRTSSALVGDLSGERLYAVLPDLDRVAIIDLSRSSLSGHLETCSRPRSLSLYDSRLAIACPSVDEIWIYDLTDTAAPEHQISLSWGDRPFGLVFSADRLYATLQGTGELLSIEPDSGSEDERIALGPDLRGLAWMEGTLIASRHRSPDSGGQWWTIDEATGHVSGYTLEPDPGPDSDTNSRGIPGYLQRIAIRPDGRTAVFPGLKSNTERGLYLEGTALDPETTVRSILRHAVINSDEGELGSTAEEPLFDNRDLGTAAAYSPLGDVVFVAHQGTQMVDALDGWSMQRIGGFQHLGHGLSGLWVDPDGETLWALLDFDRQLVALPIEDLSESPTERARIDLLGALVDPMDESLLAGQRLFHGSLDTRMSHDGYISCASCHLDGEDDGRTWDFTQRGEGVRNTTSLLGRTHEGHGPLHWSGNFDEVQDFEIDMRLHMGGAGFLNEEDWVEHSEPLGLPKAGLSEELDDLAAYISSLRTLPRSPWRDAEGALTAEAARGEEIFHDPAVGCSECHLGDELTDSRWIEPGLPLLHDVGTLTDASGQRMSGELWGLDTPSLRGLHSTAPYLHDGSAPDVVSVLLDANPDDRHGATSTLDDHQINDLAEYILSQD